MIENVKEFIVKEEYRGRFELLYGPGGAWSKLFSRCPGFRGTTVMRETRDSRRYLAVDVWDTEELLDQAMKEHDEAYADLQGTLDEWTVSKDEVGTFRVLAEATVRPIRKAGRGKSGRSRPSSG